MLEIIEDPLSASRWCEDQRKQNHTVGLVPTMGALHAGHLSLIERSIAENDVTCVSIFVNPLQFNDPDDFATYPRNMQSDYEVLEKIGCNMVFGGNSRNMFPEASSIDQVEILDPGPFALGLEGTFRPGHLEGVCTVVDRLFRFVGNSRSYFGLKDYQQLLVIQDLANRFDGQNVVACQTVRDKNGLALSSRNQLLSESEIIAGKQIHGALTEAHKLWNCGVHECDQLRTTMKSLLENKQIQIEYADVRDPYHWQSELPVGCLNNAVALVAVQIGGVRLIDNLRLDSTDTGQTS